MFLASPGDCDAERDCVRTVAEAISQTVGTKLGVRVRVTGWEYVAPNVGRPQDQINPLVDECDVFVGVVGYRWGAPTGTHSSGFYEEYERAAARRRDGERPHVALFFRQVPEEMASDPGPQLRQVLEFRQRLQDEHLVLYANFGTVGEFERLLWQLLASHVVEAARLAESVPGGTSETVSAQRAQVAAPPDANELDEARRQVMAATDAVTQRVRGVTNGPVFDPDRLLLVAMAVNDDAGYLPAHVANRLYKRRDEITLSVLEASFWLRTVVADLARADRREDRVIPGWALLGFSNEDLGQLLEREDEALTVGTFRALRRLAVRPEVLWNASETRRLTVASLWKVVLGRAAARDSALEYLASLAGPDDVTLLDAILAEEGDADVRELVLTLKGDPAALARAVAESPSPAVWKANVVLAHLGGVGESALRSIVLSHGAVSADLRLGAFRSLLQHKLVDDEVLNAALRHDLLVQDVFTSLGAEAGVDRNQLMSVAESIPPHAPGAADLVARARAATSTVDELRASLSSRMYSIDVWEALCWTASPEVTDLARRVFDTDAAELVAPLLDDKAWTEELLQFVRCQARLSALRLLASLKPVASADLARMRAEVARGDPKAYGEDVGILASVATPDDVADLLDRLPNLRSQRRDRVVQAVLKLGGSEAARKVVHIGNAKDAATAVAVLGADPTVPAEELFEPLYSEQDDVRIAALDQVARRVDADGLPSFLNDYVSRSSYYYNVVVELDWLVHMSPAQAGSGA